MRLHDQKTIANVILPFSNNEDEKTINNFLRILANNDARIKQSYDRKKLGGYISLNKVEPDCSEGVNGENNCEFRFTMIYDNIGKLINPEEIWMQKLEEVKAYIDENRKRPSSSEQNNKIIRSLGLWTVYQVENYTHIQYNMKNKIIYNKWTEFINHKNYKQYFISNEDIWDNKLNELIQYIDTYHKRPTINNKLIEIKALVAWSVTQIQNYKKKKCIMKNEIIYNKWTEFINHENYKQYFISNEDIWDNNFNKVIQYIDTHHKRPSSEDKDKQINSLGRWVLTQTRGYKKKKCIMKNEIIYNKWTEFINHENYKQYFISNEDIWDNNFNKVIQYIDTYNKRPSSEDKDKQINSLGKWVLSQIKNYKKKEDIMKNEIIYNKWDDFIHSEKYSDYFESNENKWINMLNDLKKYIDDNNKIPSYKNDKILYNWQSNQKDNYKKKSDIMQDEFIYNKWTEFISDKKYRTYFLSYKDKWVDMFNMFKIYIDTHNKKPSARDKNNEINSLGKWVLSQNRNYKKKIDTMKDENIRILWEEYKQYFN